MNPHYGYFVVTYNVLIVSHSICISEFMIPIPVAVCFQETTYLYCAFSLWYLEHSRDITFLIVLL